LYRDGLVCQSKSLRFCVVMLKSGLSLQRQYKSSESVGAGRSVTPTPTNRILDGADTPDADLLDQILHTVHDCNDRLFVGFMESTFRHTCRTEHCWSVYTVVNTWISSEPQRSLTRASVKLFELGVHKPGGLSLGVWYAGGIDFRRFLTPSLPIFGVILGLFEATKMCKLFQ